LRAGQRPNPFIRREPAVARKKVREKLRDKLVAAGNNPDEPYSTTHYLYTDKEGNWTMEAVRREYPEREGKERKQSWFQRLDGNDKPGLEGVERTLYNLREVQELEAGNTVCVVEGEKDVETVRKLGLTATTSPFGSGSWKDDYTEYLLGKRVVLIPDNDEAGRRYADDVARSLLNAGQSPDHSRCVDLSPMVDEKGDVSDFLAPGENLSERYENLQQLIENAPV